MLLNILHTIAITCAVGTNFYIGKPQPKQEEKRQVQNRDTNRTAWEEEANWDPYQVIYGYDELEYVYERNGNNFKHYVENRYYNRLSMTNTYLNATGLRFTSIPTITNHIDDEGTITNTTYSVLGVGGNELDPVIPTINTDNNIEGTWEYIVVAQRLYILRIDGNGNNVETSLTLNETLLNIADYNKYEGIYNDNDWNLEGANITCYARILNSTNNMSDIMNFNLQTINKYWVDHNLYKGMNNIMMNSAGYNSTVSEKMLQTTRVEDTQNAKITTSIEIRVQPNQTNYYLIYLEPRILTNKNLPVVQHYTTSIGNVFNVNNEGSLIVNGINVVVPGTIEVVDIPGTMIYVLGMPFTFVSTAFNLTIFPGTPYQINISILFLGILAALIFVFLIKIIIRAAASGGA